MQRMRGMFIRFSFLFLFSFHFFSFSFEDFPLLCAQSHISMRVGTPVQFYMHKNKIHIHFFSPIVLNLFLYLFSSKKKKLKSLLIFLCVCTCTHVTHKNASFYWLKKACTDFCVCTQ